MSLTNSRAHYGAVARSFHWLTALLIFTAFALGVIANELPFGNAGELARKARLFSIHKTLGTLVFFVALARILWALTQVRPAALHPERRLETLAAEIVHWGLYISLVAVPLSGWIHHAAVEGFAPILWPFGQGLPFVPKSETVAHVATVMHWLFTKVLLAAVLLHVAGALKHVVIDRDATLARMLRGTAASAEAGSGVDAAPHAGRLPMLAAFAVYLLAFGAAWQIAEAPARTGAAPASTGVSTAAEGAGETAGNWAVESGTLSFTVRQMGAEVSGGFAGWTAAIRFDEPAVEGRNGAVRVEIDTTSLSLGSVTDQAKGADFFDIANHPTAIFDATIRPAEGADGASHVAEGSLTLRGVSHEVALPFALEIRDGVATMQGQTVLDRRDYGMGENYGDEGTVGFSVTVSVELTARHLD
ncbi:cytochrome b/b6 domain-containing protein [Pseudogemmobacter sonorensis]|uniref:cytochrome b/b6 domain-containing protein n=1 Tax=Pseudogemmobacter sonorensis TaxID=2989681 RepID=UPI003696E971